MTAVRNNVVAIKGSTVTLKCRGRKVHKLDTEVKWKFNGHDIKDDINKEAVKKYRLPKRKGTFYLHITNVSEKDVGKYACVASVSNTPKADVDEDFIELSLYKKGEFHLLLLLLYKFLLIRKNSSTDDTCLKPIFSVSIFFSELKITKK